MIKNTLVITKTQIEELICMKDVLNSVEVAFSEDALMCKCRQKITCFLITKRIILRVICALCLVLLITQKLPV